MSDPTPSQALLLFGLLARHGECRQAELMPAVKKADREALAKARLIGVGKAGRGLKLTLDDAGWAWAADHLAAELPPPQRALADLLARLGEHLAKSGETLADFIGSKPERVAAETKPPETTTKPETSAAKKAAPKATKASKKATTLVRDPASSARKQIERAFMELTDGRTGTDVLLADLRPLVPNVDREVFDAALAEMHLEGGKARLMRIENNRAVTEADRSAAFHFKNNVFHALWMEP